MLNVLHGLLNFIYIKLNFLFSLLFIPWHIFIFPSWAFHFHFKGKRCAVPSKCCSANTMKINLRWGSEGVVGESKLTKYSKKDTGAKLSRTRAPPRGAHRDRVSVPH